MVGLEDLVAQLGVLGDAVEAHGHHVEPAAGVDLDAPSSPVAT